MRWRNIEVPTQMGRPLADKTLDEAVQLYVDRLNKTGEKRRNGKVGLTFHFLTSGDGDRRIIKGSYLMLDSGETVSEFRAFIVERCSGDVYQAYTTVPKRRSRRQPIANVYGDPR